MRFIKFLNLSQIFLKIGLTILTVSFLFIEKFIYNNPDWLEVVIITLMLMILIFIIEIAVEYPIMLQSNSLALFPPIFLLLPVFKKIQKRKIIDAENSCLEQTGKEKISENRIKISYLISSLVIKVILAFLLILFNILNSVQIYWTFIFIIAFAVIFTIDIILTIYFIKNLLKNSKYIAGRSAVLEV
ncbi:hypothetical protein SSABA_v1c07760 [Spiroplasma sabaudiense Ar-1343]|uniref:Transmembrane protein n=1 Tax=Spiroplasma sabaudiense Ar-1343 TaxID=1276257 RepID=W6AAG9_9MOLU|nr:hypothetical protein [Spiroplasma sabaudiense]AHI54178.1 hypothetical protein SSABA_v1c07760 [Spiroplasma sabaudiense Ar-1343]